MSGYRLYFLDGVNRIIARVEFRAPSDSLAMTMAAVVAAESSDLHSGYMLWQGARQVFTTEDCGKRALAHALAAMPLAPEAQRLVVVLEEALLDSPWSIAKSPRLLAATARLKEAGKLAG